MQIALIIYGRLDTLSGGYLYDRQLVHHLQAAGDTVSIISLPWSRYGRHLLHNASPSLFRRLRRARFDLLLQDELNHPSLFALNRLLQGQISYPIVSIVHHLRSSEHHPARQLRLYGLLERAYLRSVDGYIFNSRTTKTAVETLAAVPKPSIVAFPAADHLHANLPPPHRERDKGPLRLLFVGNVIPRKGLHVLLAALTQLPPASWRLAVVGDAQSDPTYTRRLRHQIAAAAMQQDITWHGRVSDHDLARQFLQNDLLVVPSTYEGFGIVYLEALSFGLPVIATTAGAARELITDGENGFLVAPEDVAALASCLRRLQLDRALLASMSVAALARYAAAPTWAESMADAREFLLRIAAHGPQMCYP